MNLRNLLLGAALAGVAACSGGAPEAAPPATPGAPTQTPGQPAAQPAPPAPGAQAVATRCEPSARMPLEGRASPYDSATIAVGGSQALVCYGRPAARGRTMIGSERIPFGQLWRTGANEPTIIHLPFAAQVAGMAVGPGSYSLYTIPGEREWTVIVNRSIAQWGHESAYTDAVRAQEVGRATVPAGRTESHVEQFTIRSQPAGADRADLIMEWENTRVAVPIALR